MIGEKKTVCYQEMVTDSFFRKKVFEKAEDRSVFFFFLLFHILKRRKRKGQGGFVRKMIKRDFFPYWKFFICLFLAGFILGTLFSNFAYRKRGQDVAKLQLFSLEAAGSESLNYEEYFFYLLPDRIGRMAVLQVIGATVLGIPMVIGVLLMQGFLCGAFLGITLLQNGVKGMFLFLAALLPQYLLYVPAVFGMYTVICCMAGEVTQRGRFPGKKAVQYCLWCLLFLTVTLWGILLECYLNPPLLRWFLKTG